MASNIGRPPTLKSATRRNIYIPDALWEYAKALGSGSSAEGIRIALNAYKQQKHWQTDCPPDNNN